MAKIKVLDTDITVVKTYEEDYISLTDIANSKDGEQRAADIIKNWIRNRGTLEFIGTWEQMYNQDFKVVEFNHFKMQAGLPSFVLSPGKWIEKTNAKGIIVKARRYGGTYAHKDIAFEFAGMTAREWRDKNSNKKGNIRDEANVYQLICLANLESLNAHFINEGISQSQRLEKLNQVAISQMQILTKDDNIKKLESK